MSNKLKKIAIIGPAQVGKSTLFRSLVKERGVKRFSYPASGVYMPYNETWIGRTKYQVYDMPASATLIPTNEEEGNVLNFLLKEDVEKIILVLDENAVKDNLLLLIQVAELKIPFVTAIYRKTGFSSYKNIVNANKIEALCNTRVVQVTPLLNIGIGKLKKALIRVETPRWVGSYKEEIESIIMNIEALLMKRVRTRVSLRFLALGLVLNCREIRTFIRESVSEKRWLRIVHYLKRVHSLNNAFYIANRISEIQTEIVEQIAEDKNKYEKQNRVKTSLISSLPGGNIFFLLAVMIAWYYLVISVGSRWLVKLLYNDLVGKYLEPALSSFFNSLDNIFIQELFVGKYGLVTIWFSYSFAIILPTLLVFFLILTFLNESGLFTRLAILFHGLLRRVGLSGYSMSILILSSSCKVISFLKTKLLNSDKERKIIMLISILVVPCIAQLGIINLTVTLLPWPLMMLFFLVLLVQLLAVALLFNRKKEAPDFVVSVTPIVIPDLKKVFQKTWNYVSWYINEATPLLLVGNIVLFTFHYSGTLEKIKGWLIPPIVNGLMLPKSIVDSIFLGFFRKDLGAIFLYDLVNTGELTAIQLFVSLLLVTTAIPCIGVTFVLMKRRGLWYGLRVTMYSLLYTYTLAYFFNWFLRL